MKASQLIRELAELIEITGDKEVMIFDKKAENRHLFVGPVTIMTGRPDEPGPTYFKIDGYEVALEDYDFERGLVRRPLFDEETQRFLNDVNTSLFGRA